MHANYLLCELHREASCAPAYVSYLTNRSRSKPTMLMRATEEHRCSACLIRHSRLRRQLMCSCSTLEGDSSVKLAGDLKTPEAAARSGTAAAAAAAAAEAAAADKQPSVAARVASVLGNLTFYGLLLGGAGFVGSTYVYSDERVRKMRDDAEERAGGGGPVAGAQAAFLDWFCEAREWYSEKVRGFTGAL